MLNKPLFDALRLSHPETDCVKEDDIGSWSTGKSVSSFGAKKRGPPQAFMEDWGEVYQLGCPRCNDGTKRLFVGHRWGTTLVDGDRALQFSKYLFRCQNEHCNVLPFLEALKLPEDYAIAAVKQVQADNVTGSDLPGVAGAGKGLVRKMLYLEKTSVPPDIIKSLSDPATPPAVTDYLTKTRHFDIEHLETHYQVGWVPYGTTWPWPNKVAHPEPYEFHEDRVFIPIFCHMTFASWQARSIRKEAEMKYFTEPGTVKTQLLYNFDRALLYRNVIIFEGVTNVWRCGFHGIAVFGKTISAHQLMLMKSAWGYDGRGVLCWDEDTWNPAKSKEKHPVKNLDLKYAAMLRDYRAFSGGVAVLRLRNGDAADHTYERMRYLTCKALELATNDNLTAGVLDEADVPAGIENIEPVTFPDDLITGVRQKLTVPEIEDGETDEDDTTDVSG